MVKTAMPQSDAKILILYPRHSMDIQVQGSLAALI